MATGHNLEEELRNLLKGNPNYDVRFLLPQLDALGIINKNDRALIENSTNLTDAANVLFTQIMPMKDKQKKKEFFSLLKDQGLFDLPATQVFKLFLSYLTDNFPQYDIRNQLLPLLTANLIISSHERAIIEDSSSSTDAAIILFLNYMPHKGQQKHQQFIKVLRKNDLKTLADHLAPMIDQFYARPNDHSRIPRPLKQSKLPRRQLQPINRLNAVSTYNIEYQALVDVLGSQNPINIQPICQPIDFGPYVSYYDFHGRRWALLINNCKYDELPDDQSKNRIGSLIDYNNMNSLLRGLGYEVVGKQDRTAMKMMDDVTEFAANMAKEGDIHSCVVVVMTHGDEDRFIGVDNQMLDHRNFFKVITENKALVGKPKIFIIEASRGSKINLGAIPQEGVIPIIAKQETNATSRKSTAEQNDGVPQIITERRGNTASKEEKKIAADADTCILYATAPGYFSWRNKTKGAWFSQTICQEFSAHAHQPWADLLTLSMRVIGTLAETFHIVPLRNSQDGFDLMDVVQLPVMEVNMRKKFHFFPGKSQATAP